MRKRPDFFPVLCHTRYVTLLEFLNQSPTQYHATSTITKTLRQSGWISLQEQEKWFLEQGRGYYIERSGSGVIAFRVGAETIDQETVRGAVAHTDSPGLKIKPLSQSLDHGTLRVGVELYGAPIVHTWLDRELVPAGRIMLASGGGITTKLVQFPYPAAIIPNLAIHFNREVNTKGAIFDPQTQLSALFPSAPGNESNLEDRVASLFSLAKESIFEIELFLSNSSPPALINPESGFLAAGCLDNQAGCHALLTSLLEAPASKATQLGAFFAGEEAGSVHRAGAQSSFLNDILDRIIFVRGGTKEDLFRMKSRSFIISVDAAHGIHPNYADKHDPFYSPIIGGGPVLKTHASLKYASTGETSAHWGRLCELAKVKSQRMIMRSDLSSGSTIGPMVASNTGIDTVDVGIPIWAMHSIRETASILDQDNLIKVLGQHFTFSEA